MFSRKLIGLFLGLICTIFSMAAQAEDFVVRDIRVEGLQRISYETVMEYLPVKIGETLSTDDTSQIIHALYQTGFFTNVQLSRSGNTLIIKVEERATIGFIRISGNKQIKTKDLMDALKQAGIAEGLVYDQSTLSAMKQALVSQYYNLGRYNATVETTVTPQSRNRVEVDIRIYEGKVARIKQINIIGNHAFSTKELLGEFKLTTARPWSFFTKTDEYSREKLEVDLDTLRSYYMDRGYMKFTIDSTDVTITPNRKDVYITIHVTEGPMYRIKGYRLTGNLLGKEPEVRKLIPLKQNEVFSRAKVLAINKMINNYYADQGYAMSNVTITPTFDDQTDQVFLTFEVKPGERIYVRRINFIGNTKTADYVLRRESRQLESALYSTSKIEETKRRLNNLGYLEDIKVETLAITETSNQVDLNVSVKEASSATASAQVGYSDANGFLYGANIVERNFRGTGKAVSLAFNNSQFSQAYSFNYFNPYYTVWGVSRGFGLTATHFTPGDVDLASYTLNVYGAAMKYVIPMSDYDQFSVSYGYEYSILREPSDPSTQISDFVNQHGTHFNTAKVTAGWTHSSLDRAIFPTKGFYQWIGVEGGLPILPNALDYYKATYDAKYYQPIAKGFILFLYTDWGYGNGYGSFDELPFFKNYYMGGIGSVRGYEPNTLGPRDSNDNPIGGNVKADASVNLIFPNPLGRRVRTSVFVDGGNAFDNQFSLSQIRYSAGFELEWMSPMGILKFALAKALNPDNDSTKFFDFSVGAAL